MITLVKELYNTYRGDRAFHQTRLISQMVIAIFAGLSGYQLIEKSSDTISLVISVLTGFGFTALFSEPSLSSGGLASPRNETDRENLRRIKAISLNFRARMRIFLWLAIFELTLLTILAMNFDVSIFSKIPEYVSLPTKVYNISYTIGSYLRYTGVGIAIFVFIEWMYTFYRLAESILAILDIHNEYMTSRDA